jgi:hypothetical protein
VRDPESPRYPLRQTGARETLIDGVKSAESKGVIKSVLMIQCPKEGIKGSCADICQKC